MSFISIYWIKIICKEINGVKRPKYVFIAQDILWFHENGTQLNIFKHKNKSRRCKKSFNKQRSLFFELFSIQLNFHFN